MTVRAEGRDDEDMRPSELDLHAVIDLATPGRSG